MWQLGVKEAERIKAHLCNFASVVVNSDLSCFSVTAIVEGSRLSCFSLKVYLSDSWPWHFTFTPVLYEVVGPAKEIGSLYWKEEV